MPRYNLVREKYENKTRMKTNIQNDGILDVRELYENNSKVLNDKSIAKSEFDSEEKLISLGILRGILKDFDFENVSLKNPSLISDIKTIDKEKVEIDIKCDVLLDEEITPELKYTETRDVLVISLNTYLRCYIELNKYMKYLLEEDDVTDENYKEFDRLLDNYILAFGSVNKNIQISTQVIMSIQSSNVLKITDEKINSYLTYKLIVQSTNGPMFKQGHIDTELYCNVYKSNEDVTEEFTELQFRWSRKSKDSTLDGIWASSQRRGKKIHISNKDYVAGGCSFICTLYDADGRVITSSER